MSTLTLTIKYLFIDLVGGVLRWPAWWYTRGFVMMGNMAMNAISNYAKSIALMVWIKNIFVPMFGLYDWRSRIISFLMRVFQIIARGIALFVMTVLVFAGLLLYLVLPVVSVFAAVYHLTGGFFDL